MKRYSSFLKAFSGVFALVATSQVVSAQLLVENSDIDTVNSSYDFVLTGAEIQGDSNFSTTNLGGSLVSQQNFAGGPEVTQATYFWFAWNNSDPEVNHSEIVMGWDLSDTSYGITSVDIYNILVVINPGMVSSLSYSTDNFDFTTFAANAEGANSYNIGGLNGSQTFYLKVAVDGTDYSFPNNQWGRVASGDATAFSASFDLQAVPEPSTSLLLVGAAVGGWFFIRARKRQVA